MQLHSGSQGEREREKVTVSCKSVPFTNQEWGACNPLSSKHNPSSKHTSGTYCGQLLREDEGKGDRGSRNGGRGEQLSQTHMRRNKANIKIRERERDRERPRAADPTFKETTCRQKQGDMDTTDICCDERQRWRSQSESKGHVRGVEGGRD